jgi:uncharacterized protein (TIGR02757 family)
MNRPRAREGKRLGGGGIGLSKPRKADRIRKTLDEIYDRYTRREYADGDPLMFLYRYESVEDREIAGLVASALAYGNVRQIERSVGRVLAVMGASPRRFLMSSSRKSLDSAFAGFKHRWTTGDDLSILLCGAAKAIRSYGSLEACFIRGLDKGDEDIVPASIRFIEEISKSDRIVLMPSPCRGSACKRLNLYLRWMARNDRVDPGCWKGIPPSKLLVPLDTHMYRICTAMGMSARRTADLRTAREITEAFREYSPDDPVRYDFALTRVGMRRNEDEEGVFYRLLTGGAL